MLMTIAKGLFYALFFDGEKFSGIFKFLFMTFQLYKAMLFFFDQFLFLYLHVGIDNLCEKSAEMTI